MMRAAAVLFGFLVLGTSASAQVIGHRADSVGVVTLATMSACLEESAREIGVQYPGQSVARTAAFDIAWPLADENTGGYAVLLIAAESHVEAELPVRRVYLRTEDGREIELQHVSSTRATVVEGSLAASMFGPFEEYSFYWAPLGGLQTRGAIVVDFATGRTGFRIGTLPANSPDWYAGTQHEAEPNVAALMALRAREFPGFVAPHAVEH